MTLADTITREIMPEINYHVLRTVKNWFGEDAQNIIDTMEYCDLNESWVFEYRAPFNPAKMGTYHISKWDGSIEFFEN